MDPKCEDRMPFGICTVHALNSEFKWICNCEAVQIYTWQNSSKKKQRNIDANEHKFLKVLDSACPRKHSNLNSMPNLTTPSKIFMGLGVLKPPRNLQRLLVGSQSLQLSNHHLAKRQIFHLGRTQKSQKLGPKLKVWMIFGFWLKVFAEFFGDFLGWGIRSPGKGLKLET